MKHVGALIFFLPVIILAVGLSATTWAGAPVAFTNVTVAAGVNVAHSSAGFAHANYTGGGAVGDFDNDGWQDLFVLSGGLSQQPDWLFINNRDGTFTDKAAEWGLTDVHLGKGVSVGDVNGDGLLDIYVTSAGPPGLSGPGHHRLYMNTGTSFTEVAEAAGVNFTAPFIEDSFGSSFGDYDMDGDLDLFVAGFSLNNGGSRLFENDGTGFFTDVTDEIGFFDTTELGLKSFAPRFADMDGDGYPEMLLASDFGTSRYYRNNGDRTFTDVTESAGTGLDENGMGQTIGDFNGDGLLDWYVTSIFIGDFYSGNKLYLNDGDHKYTEVGQARGVDDGGYGWGAVAVDFNHDGLLDIAETNGSSGGAFRNEQAYLWIQNETGAFDEVAIESGFVHLGNGRGMSNFDYDRDGDQDVVIFANNEGITLFRNDLNGKGTNWLTVFLDREDDASIPPNGYGALVTVILDDKSIVRMITGGDNFLSHSELSAHFGLGDAERVDTIHVDWPDGRRTTVRAVDVNQYLTIGPPSAGMMECPKALGGTSFGKQPPFGDIVVLLSVVALLAFGPRLRRSRDLATLDCGRPSPRGAATGRRVRRGMR